MTGQAPKTLWEAAAAESGPARTGAGGRPPEGPPLGMFLLLGILRRWCRGAETAWTARRLREALARLGVRTRSDYDVREWAARLVLEHRQPVGSGQKGFYLCETAEECFHAAEWLSTRIAPIRRRADALRDLGRELAAGQEVLGFADADRRLRAAMDAAGLAGAHALPAGKETET